jgi:hypothetical protein
VIESPGRLAVFFYGDDTIPMVLTDSGGTNDTGQTEANASGACDIPGVTEEEMATLQSVVITCSESQNEPTLQQTWTTSIRMRRTVCDQSIDSDGDRLSDCREFALQTEPHNPDTDGDGLSDGDEVLTHKTDPLTVDTDGGGVGDGNEVAAATDPLDPVDDFANCRYMNTSFIAGWRGDFDIEQHPQADTPLHWMRYSWSDVRFCVDTAGVRLASTGSRKGAVVLPEDVAYVFYLLDFSVKYSGSGAVRSERLTDGSLQAKVEGRFKFCTGIPLLGTLVGKGIKAVLKMEKLPARFETKLLEWGRRKIFESPLVPTWIKNEIVERGVKAVLKSFDALSDHDYKAVMRLFWWNADKVGGKLAQLVLGDLLCFTVWRPEIVARFMGDGAYDTFVQGPTGPFEVMKDF